MEYRVSNASAKTAYVDKTEVIYRLVTEAKVYFLSRPRRFGKSLLCSTLKAYFEGDRELFRGLAIEKLETQWQAYPVLYFDFNGQVYNDGLGLKRALDSHLRDAEALYCNCELPENIAQDYAERFRRVIIAAHQQTGKRVVVIVDEYDKPLLESLENSEAQEQSRVLFKGFFGNLKKLDEHLKFVFFTGVTKFSKVSIFSDLNQLRDISLEPDYETICGISADELSANFTERVQNMADYNNVSRDECFALLKKNYDGYHFSRRMTDMYNPFSILRALASREFDFYWFSTGTPTFLVKRLTSVKNEFDFKRLTKGVSTSIGEITDYRPENIAQDYAERFRRVIIAAHQQTGKRVVVIVDEYDKPLLESLENSKAQEQSRALFKGFFGNLKKLDEHLKFVFFTGVTKFSKVSIFSNLNQLKDISLNDNYETICGISADELTANFAERIRDMANHNKLTVDECLALLKKNYDGYHFSERMTDIYNPFSILNALVDSKFNYYWFSTGTPTFLVKRLTAINNAFDFKRLTDGVSTSVAEITDYRPENTNIIPLLYQSGYLTIKAYNVAAQVFTLAYPNEEVKYGMLNSLAPAVTDRGDTTNSLVDMRKALDAKDVDAMMLVLKSVYASLPYIKPVYREDMDEEDRQDVLNKYIERDFQNVIYIFFLLMGQPTYSEVQNNLGRADCIVETDKYVYLFEFKVESSAEEALAQIKAHEYATRYAADRREVICVGVNFGRRKRNITEWKVEGRA